MSLSLDDALPEKRAARRAFDRARDFDAPCFIHDEARARLLARLDLVRLAPEARSSISAARTARGANALAARYPARARARRRLELGHAAPRRRDARRAPSPCSAATPSACRCAPHCAELVLANLVLPWCRPDRAVRAKPRACSTEGGAVLFATLGPDSLQEVRAAFAAVDDRIHVHAAFDMHDLGDLALAAGLAEPVLDVDRIEVTYARPRRAGPGPARRGGHERGRRPPPQPDGRGALAGASRAAWPAAPTGASPSPSS